MKKLRFLTLLLRGNANVLYNRYIHRMNEDNRHPDRFQFVIREKSEHSGDSDENFDIKRLSKNKW